MARNMPLITTGRKLDTPDQRSAAGQLCGIINGGKRSKTKIVEDQIDLARFKARIPMRRRQDTMSIPAQAAV
jgi:hypothetical protein